MSDIKEEAVAAYLTEADVSIVQMFVDEFIIGKNQSMIARDIFAQVKDKLTRKDMPESVFMGGLSANVRRGYIVGIIGKKRVGYVACEKTVPRVKVSPQEAEVIPKRRYVSIPDPDKTPVDKPVDIGQEKAVIEQKPLVSAPSRIMADYKYAHHIWLGRKMFKLKRSFKDIESLVCDILDGRKQDDGSIVFNGEAYHCDNVRVLEKFILQFLGAMSCGESDPVLNDGSLIPVELRIAS